MYISPYDTRVCRQHQMEDIYRAVQLAMINSTLRPSPIGERRDVFVVDDRHTQIRPFAHPYPFEDSQGRKIMVFDSRAGSRVDRTTNQLRVTKEITFLDLISKMMLITWLDTDGKDLLNLGDLPLKVFARLFSENLGRRSKLDHSVIQYIEIVAAYYYCCLHHREELWNEGAKINVIKRVSRSIGIQEANVRLYLDDLPYIGTLERLCNTLSTSGLSVILEKVNPGFIYTILGGIWFGPDAKETAAVAMEFPPIFAAMIYMVSIDRSYKKTILSNILDSVDRNQERRKIFVTSVNRMSLVR